MKQRCLAGLNDQKTVGNLSEVLRYTSFLPDIITHSRYMVTEIGARDLGDQQRYNMLEVSES